jgi:hypothetical protein
VRTEVFLECLLPDLLHALRYELRARATQRYHTELTVWATLAPHVKKQTPPPNLPEILA